jgi:SepF-like predicted cell division protein (DUF552 family)
MPFNLFHKKKQPEQQILATPSHETAPQEAPIEQPQLAPETAPTPVPEPVIAAEEPKAEAPAEPMPEPAPTTQEQPPETPVSAPEPTEEAPVPVQEESKLAEQPPAPVEQPKPTDPASKTYLKAMPLKDLADVETIKNEVRNGNIIILRITPLAGKSIEDVKTAVNDLFAFAESIQGDIARLGEERVVICPKPVRIWREKTPAPVTNKGPLPTAA